MPPDFRFIHTRHAAMITLEFQHAAIAARLSMLACFAGYAAAITADYYYFSLVSRCLRRHYFTYH